MQGDERRLDGNAAAGVLSQVFGFEPTTAVGMCDACGTAGRLGRALVYAHGMGMIVRCAACDHALIRVAHIRGEYRLDMRGLRVLQVSRAT